MCLKRANGPCVVSTRDQGCGNVALAVAAAERGDQGCGGLQGVDEGKSIRTTRHPGRRRELGRAVTLVPLCTTTTKERIKEEMGRRRTS